MNLRTLGVRLDRLEQKWQRRERKDKPVFPVWLTPALREAGVLPGECGDSRYQALPAQRVFHGDLATRFKGYSGPIGSGKSYALAYEALFLSQINSGLLGLMGAPTYKMLEDSTKRTFFEVLEKENIDYTFNKQENHVYLPATGSEVVFRSMEKPDRLRGPNLAWFGLDELTYTREDAWTRMLGRLRHPEARRLCGCAVWTPNGYDWVHRRFLEQGASDYRLIQATPRENIHLPPDFYDQLKASYAERFYRQEVLGEYLDIFGGNAYYAFSEANVQSVEYDRQLPLCWALDFNVDTMSAVICQIEERKPAPWSPQYLCSSVVRVLDEIVLGTNSNTAAAAEAFIQRVAKLDAPWPLLLKIYGDASGNSRSTKAERTDYELIREILRRHSQFNMKLLANTSNPRVKDRVNSVNHMLKTASGSSHLIIDPKCKELIKDLQQVKWARDKAGNPTGELDKSDPSRTHISDALGYLMNWEFGMLPVSGERPEYVA